MYYTYTCAGSHTMFNIHCRCEYLRTKQAGKCLLHVLCASCPVRKQFISGMPHVLTLKLFNQEPVLQ